MRGAHTSEQGPGWGIGLRSDAVFLPEIAGDVALAPLGDLMFGEQCEGIWPMPTFGETLRWLRTEAGLTRGNWPNRPTGVKVGSAALSGTCSVRRSDRRAP